MHDAVPWLSDNSTFLVFLHPRLVPSATFSSSQPRAAKIKLNAAGDEYLLIENRQPIEYDRLIPSGIDGKVGGLAIWHIDMKKACALDIEKLLLPHSTDHVNVTRRS
jgi:hypothetical protein